MKAKKAESALPAASATLLDEYEKVLSQVALGAELSAILDSTMRLIDQQLSPACAGIWLAGGDRRLHFAAGPALPPGFVGAKSELEIGPASGSCGTAAWRKALVIVEDISTDPLFEGRREIALAHGVRACWAIPILSAKDRVLATCAVFSGEPRRPTPEEMRVVEGIVHVVRVAIEHWRIAADLKATTALFRALIENTSDIVTVTDPNGIIRYQSPAVERVLGYPVGQLIGTDSRLLLHPDDRDSSRDDAGGAPGIPGRSRVVVRRMRHLDGSWRLMEVEISDLIGDPAVGGIVSSARDITGPTQAAQALAAREEQYRELFENAQDMLCTLDLTGRFTSFNLTGERITGYPRAEAVGKAFWDVVSPEFRDSARALVARLMGGEGGAPQELHLVTSDGCEVPVEISSRLIFAHGKPVGVQCICRDITQRRKLEQQLLQSHKMEAIGLLAGGVAHDFNNLLTVISGCTQWVMQDLEPSSEAYENASEVMLAADRAASLTRQLLAFGRAQMFQPTRLDLNRLVANIDRMLRRLIGEDIELRTTMAPGLWIIRADPGQIEQVMLNLSLNARDAMPKGGRLVIETANCPPANESVVLDEVPPGEYVRLSFSDNGQGMDSETQARIFEPFFTTKERGRGTGLGLATVYGIVQQSGGHIRVHSEPGVGSRFSLYFPKSGEAGEETAEAGENRIDRSSGDETILLVEDEHGVRQMVREMLRRRGYRILEAPDAVSAERIFAEHGSRIHLLLSDVVMPNQSGRELAERLHARDPNLRVLFMSGYTDDAILHHHIESGTAFLQKPFTPDALARKVRHVLDSK